MAWVTIAVWMQLVSSQNPEIRHALPKVLPAPGYHRPLAAGMGLPEIQQLDGMLDGPDHFV